MPEFLINVKGTGIEESQKQMNALEDAIVSFGDTLEELAVSGKMKKFRDSLRLMREDVDALNKSLDEIIKKKQLIDG